MRVVFALALALLAGAAGAATYTVTNTNDSGAGSLRQAILDANANPGGDTIEFAIPGSDPGCDASGICTIRPQTNLPSITEQVTIDGYTQPGASPNFATDGSNAVLKIRLVGDEDSSASTTGLDVRGTNTAIRGLVVGGFDDGVYVVSATGVTIGGCFLGTDGALAVPNDRGVSAIFAPFLRIGGTDPADRNVISGNDTAGADLEESDGVQIQGNVIGPDAAAAVPLGNGDGIHAVSSTPVTVTIGGPLAGAGNLISGNDSNGVLLALGSGSVALVQGNRIGVDATGVGILGNGFSGVRVATIGARIGGTGPGEGNVIANSGTSGVNVDSGTSGVTIRGNTMFTNPRLAYALAIDLAPAGVTPNDAGDSDTGANGRQNYPIVISAVNVSGGVHIQAVLHSQPNATYDVDFYANGDCLDRPGAYLQARTPLGTTPATTDANGFAAIDVTVPGLIAVGDHVSATATDSQGNTSEVSQRPILTVNPSSGPAAGGGTLDVFGSDLLDGASLAVGGVPATGVTVNSFTHLTATLPDLTPGTVNDVTVTEPDGTAGTFEGAYVVDFNDVPPSDPLYTYVTSLVYNRITVGIGGGNYGPGLPIKRQQMAVFLEKARNGICYAPPPCSGLFKDVPCPSPFADWIEALAADGITGGCGGGNFCPDAPVRRDQMAPFLLKSEHGPGYVPPPCAGVFTDVACPSTFAPWIEQLKAENVTSGCGGTNYCPSANNTRGQMAVFVTKVFF